MAYGVTAVAFDAAEELVLRRAAPTSKLYRPLQKAKNLLEMLEIEEELAASLQARNVGERFKYDFKHFDTKF